MEENKLNFDKANLIRLPTEYRRFLLDSMSESLRTAIDLKDIEELQTSIDNLKKSLN